MSGDLIRLACAPSFGKVGANSGEGLDRGAPIKVAAQTMSIIATIMNSSTGLAIQKMKFERMPKPWVTLHLETGEQVTADRVHVGKPAPGKFITPVEVWVTPKG